MSLGDFTNNGLPTDILNFNIWLGKLPHKHKIVIAGNHDITFDTENYATKLKRKVIQFIGSILKGLIVS